MLSLLRVLLCAGSVLTAAAHAVEISNLIRVDAQQQRSLGVETLAPTVAGAGDWRRLPALVTVPNAQIRVVAAPVSGLIQTMAVAPNETVNAGRLLARLQSPMLIEAQREWLQATTQAQLAHDSLRRDEQLFREGIIAEGRYQATRAAHVQAQAALAERRQMLRLYGMGDGALDALQKGKGMSTSLDIVAPMRGVVLEQFAATGQRVEAAAPLYKIARLEPLWLEIQAPPDAIAGIVPGVRVEIGDARGRVLSVGSALNPNSQTIPVRAEITQNAQRLRVGQYVEAQIAVTARDRAAWQAPPSALLRQQGRVYVLVQVRDGFVPVEVRVLNETPQAVTFKGKLAADARVVVKGTAALKAIWTGVGSE